MYFCLLCFRTSIVRILKKKRAILFRIFWAVSEITPKAPLPFFLIQQKYICAILRWFQIQFQILFHNPYILSKQKLVLNFLYTIRGVLFNNSSYGAIKAKSLDLIPCLNKCNAIEILSKDNNKTIQNTYATQRNINVINILIPRLPQQVI